MALDDETKCILAILFTNKGGGAAVGRFIKGMANAVSRTAEAETNVFGEDDMPKTIMDVIEEGASSAGVKQTDLGKREEKENGYDAGNGGEVTGRNSQEQGGEVGKGESGEGSKRKSATTSTAEPGRTPATTGEVKTTEQLAETVATGKLSQESELENLQDSLEKKKNKPLATNLPMVIKRRVADHCLRRMRTNT